MTGGTFTVRVSAPPDTVWPWIADLEKHAEWSPHAYHVEWISGEPNAVGSRYRSVGWVPGDKNHTNEGEIVEVERPRRFGLQADDKEGRFQNMYVLTEAADGGTDVAFTLTFPAMKGLMALAAPLVFRVAGKPDIDKRMQMLKERVEAAA
jgi:uncharacterized protein YndB with AHSA1/START domain